MPASEIPSLAMFTSHIVSCLSISLLPETFSISASSPSFFFLPISNKNRHHPHLNLIGSSFYWGPSCSLENSCACQQIRNKKVHKKIVYKNIVVLYKVIIYCVYFRTQIYQLFFVLLPFICILDSYKLPYNNVSILNELWHILKQKENHCEFS